MEKKFFDYIIHGGNHPPHLRICGGEVSVQMNGDFQTQDLRDGKPVPYNI